MWPVVDPHAGLPQWPVELNKEQLTALLCLNNKESIRKLYAGRFADEDRMVKWLRSERLIDPSDRITIRGSRSLIYAAEQVTIVVEKVQAVQATPKPPKPAKRERTNQRITVRVNNIE